MEHLPFVFKYIFLVGIKIIKHSRRILLLLFFLPSGPLKAVRKQIVPPPNITVIVRSNHLKINPNKINHTSPRQLRKYISWYLSSQVSELFLGTNRFRSQIDIRRKHSGDCNLHLFPHLINQIYSYDQKITKVPQNNFIRIVQRFLSDNFCPVFPLLAKTFRFTHSTSWYPNIKIPYLIAHQLKILKKKGQPNA